MYNIGIPQRKYQPAFMSNGVTAVGTHASQGLIGAVHPLYTLLRTALVLVCTFMLKYVKFDVVAADRCL